MIDEKSLTPIFLQIANWVKDEILKGNFPEEEQIPSTNQFSDLYNINPATVGKGFRILVEEDILYKKRGIGMFVKRGARDQIASDRKAKFLEEDVKEFMDKAKSLGIEEDELANIILFRNRED